MIFGEMLMRAWLRDIKYILNRIEAYNESNRCLTNYK